MEQNRFNVMVAGLLCMQLNNMREMGYGTWSMHEGKHADMDDTSILLKCSAGSHEIRVESAPMLGQSMRRVRIENLQTCKYMYVRNSEQSLETLLDYDLVYQFARALKSKQE